MPHRLLFLGLGRENINEENDHSEKTPSHLQFSLAAEVLDCEKTTSTYFTLDLKVRFLSMQGQL